MAEREPYAEVNFSKIKRLLNLTLSDITLVLPGYLHLAQNHLLWQNKSDVGLSLIQQYFIPKIKLLCNLCCVRARLRLRCKKL